VSEAIYLRDPEGNGLELYADRPRERWLRRDGQIAMATEPLDLHSLLEAAGEPDAGTGISPGTRLGHVHLRVSDLDRAEDFYHSVLGFDVTTREYPGALFLSAGGYHHHLGVNIWGGTGLIPSPAEAPGLRHFTVTLPDTEDLAAIIRRVESRDVRIEETTDHGLREAVTLRDWDGIGVVLAVEGEPGQPRPGQ
jgi:catechol 2,3-dioxygenase